MRLFVAVVPPPDVSDHLAARVGRERAMAEPRLPTDARWTLPQRWHVTLAFVARVQRGAVSRSLPVLTDVLSHCVPPVLQLEGAGTFGGRILYTDVVDPRTKERSAELAVLAERTREVLLAHEVVVEERPFRPHLTLARTRSRAALDPLLRRMSDYESPGWQAQQVVLVESLLGEQPEYRTVATALVGPST